MKTNELCFARIGLAILVGAFVASWNMGERPASAQADLSTGLEVQSPADFYGPLSPYGSWVEVSQYGRCWRPYTVGHWEWTDCGWYWVSEEPWAWATYHYGDWTFDPAYGWIWVPGTEWAPAWVVWREAPDYIGWAPCKPGGVPVSDSFFTFVDVPHCHDRLRPQELVFNDPAILRRSHPVGRIRTETRDFNGMRWRIAINQGPGVDPIQRATGTRFTARPVTELVQQTPVLQSMRRNPAQPITERPRPTQEPAPSRTGREQQRLYREAPPAQPAPTGRKEQRLCHEVPNPQPAPRPWQPPAQPVPRSHPVPEVSRPSAAIPQRALPPTGRETGKIEPQVPRREEPPPRVAPAPAPGPAPGTPQRPPPQRQKHTDGQ